MSRAFVSQHDVDIACGSVNVNIYIYWIHHIILINIELVMSIKLTKEVSVLCAVHLTTQVLHLQGVTQMVNLSILQPFNLYKVKTNQHHTIHDIKDGQIRHSQKRKKKVHSYDHQRAQLMQL